MTNFFANTPGGAMLGFAFFLALVGHVGLSFAERRATPSRIESVGQSGALLQEIKRWTKLQVYSTFHFKH